MRALAFALRLTLILALIPALVLVSGHRAVGQSLARGAIATEICLDGGFVTVTLDADGNPVMQEHACPDCVLAGLAIATAQPQIARPEVALVRLEHGFLGTLAAATPAPPALARGPPVAVSA